MTDDERNEKFRLVLESELGKPDECIWMSFCDPAKPKGSQFLGVIIMRSPGIAHAIDRSHRMGINPGGEIFSYVTDPSDIKPEHFDQLLTKEMLVKHGYVDP